MGLDVARQHFKFDVALVVDSEVLGDHRVGVTAPDHHVTPGDRHKPEARLGEARPHTSVLAHVALIRRRERLT